MLTPRYIYEYLPTNAWGPFEVNSKARQDKAKQQTHFTHSYNNIKKIF